ncbi:hypothetical protein SLS62_001075 [Diatrype stigma]|uniref:Uncharacterized protein n=1 Tax=Diatrype stigma TaxID=117547 RepID=A0AAN9V272_9PEZI
MAGGNEDYKQASDGERSDIEVRWLARKSDLKGFYAMKQRQKGKSRDQSPESQSQSPPQTQQRRGVQDSEEEPRRSVWKHAKRVSTDEPPRNRLEEWRARRRRQTESATISSSSYLNDSASVLTMPTSPPPSSAGPAHERDDEFEQAIQAAVHETSTGDPREDARIERAIRASVTALRKRSDTVGSGMTGSSNVSGGYSGGPHTSRTLIDSKQALPPDLPPRPSSQDLQDIQDLENITDEEYQALIEQAVQLSVLEQERHRHRDSSDEDDVDFRRVLQRSQTELTISSNEQDDEEYRMVLEASHAEYANNPNHNEDEDEALRKAIEASQAEQERQKQHGGGDGGNDDALDEELRKAIEASEREHREKLALKTEEDIVMEYVKRQSLAEQQFGRSRGKQKVGSGSGSGAGGIDEEMDEDLRAALERSRQLSGRGSGGDGAADNGGGSGS